MIRRIGKHIAKVIKRRERRSNPQRQRKGILAQTLLKSRGSLESTVKMWILPNWNI